MNARICKLLIDTFKHEFLPGKQLYYAKVLYTNIDQKLQNKLHGPMHCKISVTCVFNGHLLYSLCCNNMTISVRLFQNSANCVINSQVYSQILRLKQSEI